MSSHHPSSASSEQVGYASIDEFREKVPLTTFDDYRPYTDRLVSGQEKHSLTSGKLVYFSTSSGTTGKMKLMPITENFVQNFQRVAVIAMSALWRSLPSSSFPSPEQRAFNLQVGKKLNMFQKSHDGIPIGPLTQIFSALTSFHTLRKLSLATNILSLDLIEEISDFHTSTFVQLVFALAVPNISHYQVFFVPGFIHTIKMIENQYEEMSLCISVANFHCSTLVRNNISNRKFITLLHQVLEELTIEYGGQSYRLERAEHIRKQCQQQNSPGILHRLWPTIVFASTTTGGSFSIYKQDVKFYCGENVHLINLPMYNASEGTLAIHASRHTDEYFLLPTSVFFEFVREEDVYQVC